MLIGSGLKKINGGIFFLSQEKQSILIFLLKKTKFIPNNDFFITSFLWADPWLQLMCMRAKPSLYGTVTWIGVSLKTVFPDI